jgi:hypothetical protein
MAGWSSGATLPMGLEAVLAVHLAAAPTAPPRSPWEASSYARGGWAQSGIFFVGALA